MHICFLTNEYPKSGFSHGGLGSFVKTIAEALVAKGIRVSVIGLNYTASNETQQINGITIMRIKKSTIKGLAWYFNSKAIAKQLVEVHRENRIDVVEGAELSLAFLPKISGIKYVIRLHGGHHFFSEAENRGINWWKGFQERLSFKKADGFIAVSEYVKRHTANYLSYHQQPIEVIFNPINSELFYPQDCAIETNAIVFAGTVCEKKGIRQLIQALPLVKERFPNALLHVYGRDWFFGNGSSYIAMLKDKELPKLGHWAKDVLFHGAVSYQEIAEVYAKAAVCVFPSHMETLGLVAPEAMAMEKAVVFTKLGPGPEVIVDGVTGLLCDPHQPEDISMKITQVLEDVKFANQLGKKAREAVLKQFEINNLVSRNIGFYNRIIR